MTSGNWWCRLPKRASRGRGNVSTPAVLCENWIHRIQPGRGGRLAERRSVADQETPFDSIEGSHEYGALLAEAIGEARREVEAEIALAEREEAERRKEALLLVSYNLGKLDLHIRTSRRILNDLRTLRRLLLDERGARPARVQRAASGE